MHHLTSLDHLSYVNHHSNPFVKYGAKIFSQTDEDGLTLEILLRINPFNRTYIELGVGDGMECNTLILAAMGWKGQWIGNQDLVVKHPLYTNKFITVYNVCSLLEYDPSVLSIDLDGNDYHILEQMLRDITPDLIILEYNAKFIPPVSWIMPYEPTFVWNGSDYFGASLQAFAYLLINYRLIVCNAATGANAFFVHEKHSHLFPEVPYAIRQIYVPPRYRVDTNYGTHQRNILTVQSLLNETKN
jgi:hypothetical protein